jgi:hypothetical protein
VAIDDGLQSDSDELEVENALKTSKSVLTFRSMPASFSSKHIQEVPFQHHGLHQLKFPTFRKTHLKPYPPS